MLLCLMGVGGLPHPVLVGGGVPRGTPHPDLARVPPPSRPGWGATPIQIWDRVPPHPDLGWCIPLSRPGMGYPQPVMGYPPPRPVMGYPLSRPGMGYPHVQTCDGVPPSGCRLTHKVKILPSPILRMRAVNIRQIKQS